MEFKLYSTDKKIKKALIDYLKKNKNSHIELSTESDGYILSIDDNIDVHDIIQNVGGVFLPYNKDHIIICDEPPDMELLQKETREKRKELLNSSDWTQVPDAPIANKDEWKAYRQALRDLPDTITNWQNIIWPTIPS